jgi:hypothetical protein
MTSKDLVTADGGGGLVPAAREAALIQVVLDTVGSEHTQRAYRRALVDFLNWHTRQGQPALNKATVQRYGAELRGAGVSAASINQRLTAIRKLAREAADRGTRLTSGERLWPQATPGASLHCDGRHASTARKGLHPRIQRLLRLRLPAPYRGARSHPQWFLTAARN